MKPAVPGPTLAIIIVSFNVRELLRACLTATYHSLAQSPDLAAQVWVVDNASADGSAEMVATEFPQVRLVVCETNLGFAGGNNLALRGLGFVVEDPLHEVPRRLRGEVPRRLRGEVPRRLRGEVPRRLRGEVPRRLRGEVPRRLRGEVPRRLRGAPHLPMQSQRGERAELRRPEFVLLLNPDAEPVGDAIGEMARFLGGHSSVGGAGAQLRYPDGRFQHGAYRFPGLWQLWFDLFPPRPRRLLESRLNGRYRRALYERGKPFPIDFALGAALMVRGEAIQVAGLLDESYFMYAEEVDWCWRIRRAGWSFFCVPAAQVIHHGGASTRQFRSSSFVNLWRSRFRLYERFYGPVRCWIAARIVQLGMWAEERRARTAGARSEISGEEMAQRVTAARQVAELFRQGRQRMPSAADKRIAADPKQDRS